MIGVSKAIATADEKGRTWQSLHASRVNTTVFGASTDMLENTLLFAAFFVAYSLFFANGTRAQAPRHATQSTPSIAPRQTPPTATRLPDPWTLDSTDKTPIKQIPPAQPLPTVWLLPAAPTATDISDRLTLKQMQALAKGRLEKTSQMRKRELAERLATQLTWKELLSA